MRVPEELSELSYSGLSNPHPIPVPKYQYRPLKDNETIRLLTLAPGKLNEPLKGRLDVVNVDSAGSYEPISYVWAEPGMPNHRYEILISDGDDERLLELRGGSLFTALSHLRFEGQERCIWADQICINQDDLKERGQQVQFMNKIYKNASHVLVWLGLDMANEAKPAFDLVHNVDMRLQDRTEHEKFYIQFTKDLNSQSIEEWKPLDHLTNLTWVSCSGRGSTTHF